MYRYAAAFAQKRPLYGINIGGGGGGRGSGQFEYAPLVGGDRDRERGDGDRMNDKVELYKLLNSVYPWLETAWWFLQPLNL